MFIVLVAFLASVCGCRTARGSLVDQGMYSQHVGFVLAPKVDKSCFHSFIVFTKRFSKACFSSKKFCGFIGNDLCMGSHAHRGKIVYSWIFPHPAKAGLILGGGGIVVVNSSSHRKQVLFPSWNAKVHSKMYIRINSHRFSEHFWFQT